MLTGSAAPYSGASLSFFPLFALFAVFFPPRALSCTYNSCSFFFHANTQRSHGFFEAVERPFLCWPRRFCQSRCFCREGASAAFFLNWFFILWSYSPCRSSPFCTSGTRTKCVSFLCFFFSGSKRNGRNRYQESSAGESRTSARCWARLGRVVLLARILGRFRRRRKFTMNETNY